MLDLSDQSVFEYSSDISDIFPLGPSVSEYSDESSPESVFSSALIIACRAGVRSTVGSMSNVNTMRACGLAGPVVVFTVSAGIPDGADGPGADEESIDSSVECNDS